MLLRRAVTVLSLLGLIAGLVVVGIPSTPLATAPAAGFYQEGQGYYLGARDGGMFTFGAAQFFGSTGDIRLNAPIVGMEATPFPEGYWLVANDGGIFTFGSAGFFGSTGNLRLNRPIVGMAAAPNGHGYWLVASDGGIFAFGSSEFFGSTGDIRLNQPIVGMAPTPTGKGYWMVATDGGIFSFGDAEFYGSTGDIRLNRPIVGMEPTPSGRGYWLVASDGGIFTFGDATFMGSTGDIRLNQPIVGMARSRSGNGYQLVATDGGIFNFGNSTFFGSTGSMKLNQPILAMAQRPSLGVVADAFASDGGQTSAWTTGADPALTLAKTTVTGPPAGARIYGVEGLDVGQLQTLRMSVESGPCTVEGPKYALFFDTNGDGAGDASRVFSCDTGGAGLQKSWDPVALGVPSTAVVTALDVWHNGPAGTTSVVDDLVVAGLTMTSPLVARAA